jgi:ankyrin repeat protein
LLGIVLAVDDLQRTALHAAAETRDAHDVIRLLGDGNDVDPRDYRNYTPLHLAAGVGAAEIIAFLLAAGADPAALTAFRTTPQRIDLRRPLILPNKGSLAARNIAQNSI